jgi:hypothetical protein
MNIYKGLLFLHGHLLESALTEDDFGPTYGNRVANEKALREHWEPQRDLAAVVPIAAPADARIAQGCG